MYTIGPINYGPSSTCPFSQDAAVVCAILFIQQVASSPTAPSGGEHIERSKVNGDGSINNHSNQPGQNRGSI